MPKQGKKTEDKPEGATVVQLRIDRRLSRSHDSEIWIIDGTNKEGEEVFGVGQLVIIQDGQADFIHVIGAIRHEHTLELKNDLTDQLLKRLEDLDYLKGNLFFNMKDGTIDLDWEA